MYLIVYHKIWFTINSFLCHKLHLHPLSFYLFSFLEIWKRRWRGRDSLFFGDLLSLSWPILRSNFLCQLNAVIKPFKKEKEYMSYFVPSHTDSFFSYVWYSSSGQAPKCPSPMTSFSLTCRNHSVCVRMATYCLAGFLLIHISILSFISISFLFLP